MRFIGTQGIFTCGHPTDEWEKGWHDGVGRKIESCGQESTGMAWQRTQSSHGWHACLMLCALSLDLGVAERRGWENSLLVHRDTPWSCVDKHFPHCGQHLMVV